MCRNTQQELIMTKVCGDGGGGNEGLDTAAV